MRALPAIFFLIVACARARNPKPTPTVHVRLIDAARGEVTPALVCISEYAEVKAEPAQRLPKVNDGEARRGKKK